MRVHSASTWWVFTPTWALCIATRHRDVVIACLCIAEAGFLTPLWHLCRLCQRGRGCLSNTPAFPSCCRTLCLRPCGSSTWYGWLWHVRLSSTNGENRIELCLAHAYSCTHNMHTVAVKLSFCIGCQHNFAHGKHKS